MAFIQEAPFDLQTSDLPAPSANQRILYPVDDGSTTGKQWRARDDSEVLIVMLKHNYSATTAPGTGDDVDDGYSVGSIWVDTTNGNAYICEDNSTGAAVWLQINGGGGSSLPVDDTTSLVQDPSTNSKQMRIDVGNVADSTVRVLTMPDADVELFKDNLAASSAPTTGNDNTEGYAVGSVWIDTTNDKAYVCLDASTGAAVWTETTQSGGGSSLPVDDTTSLVQDPSTNSKQMRIDVGNVADSTVRVLTMPDADVELVKNNLAASSAPTTGDDSDDGYAVSSVWIDTTNDKAYVCLDASVGAAVWIETTQSGGSSMELHVENRGDIGNTSTLSTTWIDVPNTSFTYNIQNGNTLMVQYSNLEPSGAGGGTECQLRIVVGSVNGATIGGATFTNVPTPIIVDVLDVSSLGTGNQTVKLQMQSSTGTSVSIDSRQIGIPDCLVSIWDV